MDFIKAHLLEILVPATLLAGVIGFWIGRDPNSWIRRVADNVFGDRSKR